MTSKKQNIAEKFLNEIKHKSFFSSHDVNVFPETCIWIKRDFIKRNYGDKNTLPFIILMEGNKSIAYYPNEKFDKVSEELFKKYMENPKNLDKISKVFRKDFKEMEKLYLKYSYEFIKNKSLSELQKIIPKFLQLMEPKLFYDCDKERCRKYIKGLSEKQIDELWEKAQISKNESFEIRQQKQALKEIAKGDLIENCSEEFQYFYTGLTRAYNLDKTKKELKKDFNLNVKVSKKRLEQYKKEQNKREQMFEAWYRNLSSYEKKIANYIQTIIELRDLRKDLNAKGITVLYRIGVLKILEKVGIPKEFVQFISYDELLKPLSYFKENKSKILKRKKGYGFLVLDDGSTIDEYGNNKELQKILDAHMKEDNLSISKEISGQPAFKGKVTGKIRIITSVKEQAKNFNTGDILVTSMTRPEYMILAKKAKAIITDEGGISSHAAIVAREMRKPCIVGTKIATKVFKNGDLVEVDADKGKVKILKRIKD